MKTMLRTKQNAICSYMKKFLAQAFCSGNSPVLRIRIRRANTPFCKDTFGELRRPSSRFYWLVPLCAVSLLILAGCGALPGAAPTPLPTVSLDSPSGGSGPTSAAAGQTAVIANSAVAAGGVTASGVIAPAQDIELAATVAGAAKTVTVAAGDQVKAGQVLVTFAGVEKLNAAVEAASFELLSAQQAVTKLKDDAEVSRAQAQLRLAKALDAYDQAKKRRGWKEYRVGNDNQIAVARADLIVAQDRVKQTEDVFGGYADDPADNLNKAAALSALSAARTARDKAQANLNYLLSLPDPLQVGKADAELEVARTETEAAQKAFDRLKDGPDPDALALAEARVKNAEAQLLASQAALADLQITAPFNATVTKVTLHAGEWALPGQAALALADLQNLQVETTDLSERDVPGVTPGQPVSVYIKALDQSVKGKVVEVSPTADSIGGDVVYKTTIRLDERPAALRAGMSVEVTFEGVPE